MKDMVRMKDGGLVPRTLAKMADGLRNVVSGLGTSKTKRIHNQFMHEALGDWGQMDAAYQTNWIARQIVDVPAEDMTREWRTIKCADAEIITRAEDNLGLMQTVQEAICWARLFGGSAILMITNQDLEKPLNPKKIGKGDLQRLIVFDRFDLAPSDLNSTDVLSQNYMLPEYFSPRGGSIRIHWTHFARFQGARLPRRQMLQTQGWGDSELRKCLDDIKDTVAGKDGIAELMQEANIDVITRTGLNDDLASDEDDRIVERYELYSQMKSIVNMALLDGDEKFERLTLSLSGVAPILETFMTWISGAADIPVTRLFGTSAKGMNATGDGDMNNYYNSIRSKQTAQLTAPMRVLDEVLVRSALGKWADDYSYQWNPLEQQNAVEIAQGELMRAQKNQIYLDAGVVQVSQVQKVLRSNEEFQFAENQIEELEKYEEANLFSDLTDQNKGGEDDAKASGNADQ